jgi:hypothetical protein
MPRECRRPGCGEEIDWAVTVPGDSDMPVNHDSAGAPDGDLAVWRDTVTGLLMCRRLKKDEEPQGLEKRGKNHWRTCKNPPERRRKKA